MSSHEILAAIDELPLPERAKALRQILSNALDVTDRDMLIEWSALESIAEQAWRDHKPEVAR